MYLATELIHYFIYYYILILLIIIIQKMFRKKITHLNNLLFISDLPSKQ